MREHYDVLVVGGGINGCGIANLAAQCGLSVLLVEQDDLAAHTSSASSKLIHGGLRYLEYGEFRLVREALAEREVLLAMAPHIIRPLTFILPHHKALRPVWMIRLGLLLYDHLGNREQLPASQRLELAQHATGEPLRPAFHTGFCYSDCWVDDARLVVLNAMQAREYGADVLTRTHLEGACRGETGWLARLIDPRGQPWTVTADALVNAAGPWVERVLETTLGHAGRSRLRLVKGSHIVVPRRYQGEHAYLLQSGDRRVVFVLPYGDYNLIGTTDVPFDGDPAALSASPAEIDYLCRVVNEYFRTPIRAEDVVWSFAGVRPLFDDGSASAAAVTRDYHLELDGTTVPLLSVFGGKLTTHRQLARVALTRLAGHFGRELPLELPEGPPPALPGGVLPTLTLETYRQQLAKRFPWLPEPLLSALLQRHGSLIEVLLQGASTLADFGTDHGGGLYQREVEYLIRQEWARQPEDVLWRRSKCGLAMSEAQRQAFADAWETRYAGLVGD
ncbi:glycerol-3-phosphate dehydrogenase [Pseudogulbenkiania sp. MAI-1]|uniref:glycerol-3-phosphate dehydrogenase n=1 Tax=Pseudogulbenkiania sp. MAI-1 TaxID=990370 RepID=UPI00045E8397|nr:glycerol-3-phosphate dehydrogenase [Pseudogulbenkiania sp. MAI-1]